MKGKIIMPRNYYVIWRSGGTLNAKWHRTMSMPYSQAIETRKDVEKAGYKAIITEKSISDAIGLPEGYEYKQLYPRTQ